MVCIERIVKKLQIVFFMLLTVDCLNMAIVQFFVAFDSWDRNYDNFKFMTRFFNAILNAPVMHEIAHSDFVLELIYLRIDNKTAFTVGWISAFLIAINLFLVRKIKNTKKWLRYAIIAVSVINIFLLYRCFVILFY